MFVCRTGRLCAAALDQARRAPASFLLLQANKQRRFAFTLRKGHACLCASVGGVDSTPAHPVQKWDSSTGLVVTEWGHLHRVATIAKHLSKSAQTGGAHVDCIRRPLVRENGRSSSSRGGPPGAALFTGRSTRTMHSSASSSTASATKRREEHTADCNKEDEQNIKTSSATCSSTEKLPGEPEPVGGKPNKTQQLKNVFKEYGAVGVSFHIGISLMSLGMFYLLISSGIDMTSALCKLGFSEAVVRSKMAAGTSTFVLAYAIHKLFAPVRISITLVSVPLIVRYFRKTGLFKPPTPAP